MLVPNKWDVHDFNFTNPWMTFTKLADTKHSLAMMCFNHNILGCMFNIYKTYYDTVPIMKNFMKRIHKKFLN